LEWRIWASGLSRCLKPPTRMVRLLDNVITSSVNPTYSSGPVKPGNRNSVTLYWSSK
jgi:hypothetical protein